MLIILFWVIFLYALYLMRTVLLPFLAAFILAYMLNPLVTGLARYMNRMLAIVVVYFASILLTGALIVWFMPVLWEQITLVWESLPLLVEWYNTTARAWISQRIDGQLIPLEADVISNALMEYAQKNYQVADAQLLIKQVLSSGMVVANNIGMAVMVPILTFYFLIGWQKRLDMWLHSIPKPYQKKP